MVYGDNTTGGSSGSAWEFFWMPVVFAISYGLLSLWPLACLHPTVWGDVAIAAGLHPPGDPFPGLYRMVVSLLYKYISPDIVLEVLSHLGRAAVAGASVCVYYIFRETLPAALRISEHTRRVGLRIGRMVAVLSALLFTCAEPVWRAGWTFSPTSLMLLMGGVAGALFFRFMRAGSIKSLYFCFALLGLISAETTLGFFWLVLALFGVLVAVRWARNPNVPLVNPMVDALVRAVVFKRLSYAWLTFFVIGVAGNVVQFITTQGLDATGHEGVLGLLFEYFRGAYEATISASTGPGWLFGFLLGVAPFIFVLNMLSKAWDDDHFLPWSVSMCSGVAGVVAMTQLGGASRLWFWTWLGTSREMVPCDLLLAFMLLFDVATVAMVLAIFGVDAYCRNYKRIAQQQFPESLLSEGPAQMVESLGKARTWRKRAFLALVLMVPGLVVPGRVQTTTRTIAGLIREGVLETLAETKTCDTIFTDGSYDDLLELEAKSAGRSLLPLSFMAAHNPRMRMLRMRASKNDEDKDLLENDAATAMRSWIENDSPRLKQSAVQIGFELWRKGKKEEPPYSGMVALPGGLDDEERKRALAVCADLGDRAEELARQGKEDEEDTADVETITDVALRKKFPYLLWRLARLAQQRSRAAEQKGNRGEAIREAATADMLDSANASVREMKRRVNWMKMQNGGQLTPREGLVIGLSRADFAFAGRFAAPVLAADPDDPRANFAMGMMYCQEEKYTRAEEHLRRCLIKRPNEPAVLNNLALVLMHLGRYADALKLVDETMKKNPNLAELARTRESILKAREESEKKKSKSGTGK